MLVDALLAGFGGMMGAILRFILANIVPPWKNIPWGTMAANIVGCFLLGMILQSNSFLQDGICGGITTFSTWIVEFLAMFESKQYTRALLYLLLSLLLGWSFYMAGGWLSRFFP